MDLSRFRTSLNTVRAIEVFKWFPSNDPHMLFYCLMHGLPLVAQTQAMLRTPWLRWLARQRGSMIHDPLANAVGVSSSPAHAGYLSGVGRPTSNLSMIVGVPPGLSVFHPP